MVRPQANDVPSAAHEPRRLRADDLVAAPVSGPRRIAAGFFGFAMALGVLVAAAVAWIIPSQAPFIAPVVVALGAMALWGAGRADHKHVAAEVARVAEENRRLAEEVEQLSDVAWELHEADERYRSVTEARQRAEAANQAKSRVLATVSHEFRTPLNGILGLAGLLLETPLTPDQETYARGVHSSGQALLALVDDMLDFARIEAGRLELRPAPTDVAGLLQEIAELLAARAYAKGIDIAVDADPALPAVVMVDPTRLRQILINLAGNGVKFTDAGGVTISVREQGRPAQGRVTLAFAVADSGPGIAPDEAERLFGEFEQGDSALTRRHGGAGLGLAISRRIVRHMGGELTVAPAPGGGSLFQFALDLDLAVTTEHPAPAGELLAGRSFLILAPAGAEPPVLVRHLTQAGAAVRLTAAPNEAAAVIGAAAAAGLLHDALLIDERTAADPVTALALIREAAGRRVPAAVMIEPGRRGEIDRLRAAGFDAYLVRPVRRASLTRVLGELALGASGFHIDPGDARPRPSPAPRRAGTALNVLLAEDNEINALLARAVLEGLGHAVTEVRDGAQAVAAATGRAGGFDAILMDLHMPGLDGLAAVRAIRAHEQARGMAASTILAVTADVLPETRSEARAAGIDAVLEKPMTPNALRQALAQAAARTAA
jgi:signal transduction histidine kinase/CheY-like chemotaxis protein